jgi:hypothetical protein
MALRLNHSPVLCSQDEQCCLQHTSIRPTSGCLIMSKFQIGSPHTLNPLWLSRRVRLCQHWRGLLRHVLRQDRRHSTPSVCGIDEHDNAPRRYKRHFCPLLALVLRQLRPVNVPRNFRVQTGDHQLVYQPGLPRRECTQNALLLGSRKQSSLRSPSMMALSKQKSVDTSSKAEARFPQFSPVVSPSTPRTIQIRRAGYPLSAAEGRSAEGNLVQYVPPLLSGVRIDPYFLHPMCDDLIRLLRLARAWLPPNDSRPPRDTFRLGGFPSPSRAKLRTQDGTMK